jgi:hypothetical protein
VRGRRRGDRIHEGRGRVGGRKWPAMAAAASLDLSTSRVMRSYTWREPACPAAGSCVRTCVSPRAVGGAARAGWPDGQQQQRQSIILFSCCVGVGCWGGGPALHGACPLAEWRSDQPRRRRAGGRRMAGSGSRSSRCRSGVRCVRQRPAESLPVRAEMSCVRSWHCLPPRHGDDMRSSCPVGEGPVRDTYLLLVT